MHDDETDDTLPPLTSPGVSALWRAIAIVSLLAVAVLLCMVIVLVVSLAQQAVPVFANQAIAPPAAAARGLAEAADEAVDPAAAPYPLQQDLRPAGTFPVPGDAEAEEPRAGLSLRREFLRHALRPAVWSSTDPIPPESILVSPDGANMAYVSGDYLIAGPLGAPVVVDTNGPVNGGMGGAGGMGMAGGWAAAGMQPPLQPRGDGPRARVCGWRDDRVFWSNSGGHITSYLPKGLNVQQTSLRAELALPLPIAADQVNPPHHLIIRTRPHPKGDGTASARDGDVTELLVVDSGGERRDHAGLKGIQDAEPESFALSPDGKRVAVVTRRGKAPARRRVVVLNLDKGGQVAATTDAARYAGVCWTPDGNALVYARSQSPTPPDHAPGLPANSCDLFFFDLETKKETRLSRGGRFSSPSVAKEDLFFVNPTASGVSLEEMPLQAARRFADEQEKAASSQAAAWTELAGAIFKEAGVPFAEDRVQLNAASIAKLVDAFGRLYPAKFQEDAPATAASLDQERRDIAAMRLAAPVQTRLRVLLGAAGGEYLRRRQKGSIWALGAHPLAVNETVAAETPFGLAVNPFQSASLADVRYRAEGRPIVLSDDAACAKEALDKLTDADLAHGGELLKQGQGADADHVLLELVKRHSGNYALAVQVGTLLHQYDRAKALAELVKPWLDQLDAQGGGLPRDAHLYNLVGIATLESNSDKAVLAFQTALRCDLNFGPAYLNLAQAYTKSGSAQQVGQCLRRYLKLFPKGEWAEDARRRLATEGEKW